jgi:hypothetical protein
MTVEQNNLIDMVSLDHASGSCTLAIVDHLAWDERHLVSLQAKINTCLQFIESGEIYVVYPASRGFDFAVDIQFIYAPPAEACRFLENAQRILLEAGYTLRFGPLGSAYADEGTK